MPRRQQTKPKPRVKASQLPELTEKQFRFVQQVLAGKSLSDAYRECFDASGMLDITIWAEASRQRHHHKVAAWISAARQAGADSGIRTAAHHISRLEEIAERAELAGNFGAAAQCEIHAGKVSRLYTDQIELTRQSSDIDLIAAIAGNDPDMAAKLRKRLLGEEDEA